MQVAISTRYADFSSMNLEATGEDWAGARAREYKHIKMLFKVKKVVWDYLGWRCLWRRKSRIESCSMQRSICWERTVRSDQDESVADQNGTKGNVIPLEAKTTKSSNGKAVIESVKCYWGVE